MTIALATLVPAETKSSDLAAGAAGAAALALAAAQAYPQIKTAAEADEIVSATRALQSALDACTKERDAVCKPLRKIATEIAGRWKPAREALESAIKIYKNRITAFELTKSEVATEALQGKCAPEQVAEAVAVMAPRAPGSHQVTRWHAEITDVSLVPREFMAPDMAALNALAKTQKGALDLPGVRSVSVTSTTVMR